jgi:hypothetical protein
MLPYKKLLLRRNAFFRQQLSTQQLSAIPVTENLDPQLQTDIEDHATALHSHTDDAQSFSAASVLQQLSR